MPQDDPTGEISLQEFYVEITAASPIIQEPKPNNMRPRWNPMRTALLIKLWEDGYSGGHIAKELGNITRNAVIGKIHRLMLPQRAKDENKQVGRRIPYSRARRIRSPQAASRRALPPTYVPPMELDENRMGIDILALNSETCRAVIKTSEVSPEKRAHYCGDKIKEHSVFCEGHHARYYNAPRLQ